MCKKKKKKKRLTLCFLKERKCYCLFEKVVEQNVYAAHLLKTSALSACCSACELV